jgi:hypothetical protein
MASRTAAVEGAVAEQVRRSLSGRRTDIRGIVFQLVLLLTLVLALAVLIVLLVDVSSTAIPVLLEDGGRIFTSGLSSLPRTPASATD